MQFARFTLALAELWRASMVFLVGAVCAHQRAFAQESGKEFLYFNTATGTDFIKLDPVTGLTVERFHTITMPDHKVSGDTYCVWRGRFVGVGTSTLSHPISILYARNPADVSVQVLGRVDVSFSSFNAVDYDQTTDKMYGIFSFKLYELDPSTGKQTLIAPITGVQEFNTPITMVISPDGVCYIPASGTNPSTDSVAFYTLNLESGVATKIGDVATFPVGSIMDMAFDGQGQLWASFWSPTPDRSGFYKIDLTTMTSTKMFDGLWSESTSGAPFALAFTRDAAVHSYCTAKVNSLGCTPQIGASGIANPGARFGFKIWAANIQNQTTGALLYSIAGPASAPFFGGTLCANPPYMSSKAVSSGGSMEPALDCSGRWQVDFNAIMSAGNMLPPGLHVQAQFIGRDPGAAYPDNIVLSNAIDFELTP